MSLGDVINQFHDKYGLTNARTTKQTNLTALHIGFQQVDNLDARGQHFLMGRKFVELRSLPMDGVSTFHVQFRHAVDGLADNVQHAAFNLFAGRHGDRTAQRRCFKVALQTVGVIHCHAAHSVFTDMLLNLHYQFAAVGPNDTQGIVNFRQHFLLLLALGVEVDVNYRTNNLRNVSFYV